MRKKTLFAAAVVIFALGAVTGCGSSADIGRDAALETALNDAGVNEEDTTRLSVAEDQDDGRKTYDIQFNAGGREYDYEIQASDGRILSSDVDTASDDTAEGDSSGLGSALVPDDGSQNNSSSPENGNSSSSTSDGQTQDNSQTQNSGNSGNSGNTASSGGSQGNSQTSNNSSGNSDVAVSIDEAIGIALDRVSGATEQDIKIELDRDDGRYKYEGEIHYNGREYEFEIDANSGTILEWSEERD